jgi:hypothetical protein
VGRQGDEERAQESDEEHGPGIGAPPAEGLTDGAVTADHAVRREPEHRHGSTGEDGPP